MERHKVFRSDRIKVTEQMVSGQIAERRVLEIGAGDYSFAYLTGSNLWIKADFSQPCDVICEFNKENLTLPFKSKSFDFVICTEVLEHLSWPQALLKECYRILTDGGKILISVPNAVSLSYRVSWLLGRIPSCAASGNLPCELGGTAYRLDNNHLIGGHVIDFNFKKIRKLLSFCNFHHISTKGSGIIWHRQILPFWVVPSFLSSNIICLAVKVSNL